MGFYQFYSEIKNFDLDSFFARVDSNQILTSLHKQDPTITDLATLLSPKAVTHLEELAQKAQHLTLSQFGKTISLYTPLYLSNYCQNECLYCGFNAKTTIKRKCLSLDEIKNEAEKISQSGLQHILILTGESKEATPLSYIKDAIKILKKIFSSVSIEIYPLSESDYAELIDTGVDGLTIYQEVYDEAIYKILHPSGPKKDYLFRIDAPERAGRSFMRTINIGALLGLGSFRQEAFYTILHAKYLQDLFPEAEISISMPRLRPQIKGFKPLYEVSDTDIVQFTLTSRLFLPRVGITLSTREDPSLRDNLIGLGITKMSAGSTTSVGGHTIRASYDITSSQFDIADRRSVEDIRALLLKKGYQPILKDWVGAI